jgi:hypothetical protein
MAGVAAHTHNSYALMESSYSGGVIFMIIIIEVPPKVRHPPHDHVHDVLQTKINERRCGAPRQQ